MSLEWQKEILRELAACDLFVAILSEGYFSSAYCVQESGIAIYRKRMTVMPLTVDGTVPQGFMSHIQANRINPDRIDQGLLYAGIAQHDRGFVVDRLIEEVGESGSYRTAEANFAAVLPYLKKATDQQIIRLLILSNRNSQVADAGLCATEYLPPLMKTHGRLLDRETRQSLAATLARYNS